MELKLERVTMDFRGFKAVNEVTYTLTNGVYGLLGVNGAGKTTLMRMLTTLLRPTSGQITWNGKDIFEMDGTYRALIGYLPQDFGYYPDFSVWDYLLYIASIKGLRPTTANRRSEMLLKQVGLWDVRKKKMKKLSGGMKRRAGIAQAMLNDPQILILDEPTAGLDPNERIRFRNLISELAEDRIVLLSTHIVSDVEYIANEIMLMQNGRISLWGTAEEIVSSLPVSVWSCKVAKEHVNAVLAAYQVSNMKTIHGGAEMRILSENRPAAQAVQETANLEDVFLYYFGERAGEHDGTL